MIQLCFFYSNIDHKEWNYATKYQLAFKDSWIKGFAHSEINGKNLHQIQGRFYASKCVCIVSLWATGSLLVTRLDLLSSLGQLWKES